VGEEAVELVIESKDDNLELVRERGGRPTVPFPHTAKDEETKAAGYRGGFERKA